MRDRRRASMKRCAITHEMHPGNGNNRTGTDG